MPVAIVFESSGRLEVAFVSEEDTPIETIAAIVVPEGTPYRVVDTVSLPKDARHRDAWTANFDSEPCQVTVDPSKVAEAGRAAAIADIEDWFQFAIAEGFVTEGGWTLGTSDTDVTLLTGNYILAKEAAALGLPLPPVIDRNGVAHTFTDVADLTALMFAYGQHRAALSAEYASRKAALGA